MSSFDALHFRMDHLICSFADCRTWEGERNCKRKITHHVLGVYSQNSMTLQILYFNCEHHGRNAVVNICNRWRSRGAYSDGKFLKSQRSFPWILENVAVTIYCQERSDEALFWTWALAIAPSMVRIRRRAVNGCVLHLDSRGQMELRSAIFNRPQWNCLFEKDACGPMK